MYAIPSLFGEPLCLCVAGMYSLIGFMDFIPDNTLSGEEICLPRVVPADKETGRHEKTLFSELEVHST